jgi:hypothetical protein
MDYHELEKKTVIELREMIAQYPDVTGASGMKKAVLVDLLAGRLGIAKPHAEATASNKAAIKARLHALRKKRDEAIAQKDRAALRLTRRRMHQLRRRLRKSVQIR